MHHVELAKAHYVNCILGVQHAESAWQEWSSCSIARETKYRICCYPVYMRSVEGKSMTQLAMSKWSRLQRTGQAARAPGMRSKV